MILGDKNCYEHTLKINLTFVQSHDEVILLGVVIDKNLDFKKHIDKSFARPSINFMLYDALENFLVQKKLRNWVMLS